MSSRLSRDDCWAIFWNPHQIPLNWITPGLPKVIRDHQLPLNFFSQRLSFLHVTKKSSDHHTIALQLTANGIKQQKVESEFNQNVYNNQKDWEKGKNQENTTNDTSSIYLIRRTNRKRTTHFHNAIIIMENIEIPFSWQCYDGYTYNQIHIRTMPKWYVVIYQLYAWNQIHIPTLTRRESCEKILRFLPELTILCGCRV